MRVRLTDDPGAGVLDAFRWLGGNTDEARDLLGEALWRDATVRPTGTTTPAELVLFSGERAVTVRPGDWVVVDEARLVVRVVTDPTFSQAYHTHRPVRTPNRPRRDRRRPK